MLGARQKSEGLHSFKASLITSKVASIRHIVIQLVGPSMRKVPQT